MLSPTITRRGLLAGIAALAAVPLAACASSGPATGTGPGIVRAKGVSRRLPAPEAPVTAVAAGMTAFAHALAGATGTTGNWIASPLSIATAFAMARVGAQDPTATSLDKVFGFPGAGRDEAFNAITRALVTTDTAPSPAPGPSPGAPPRPPVVALGNALFAAAKLPLVPAFLTTLAQEYGAGVNTVDFAGGDAVKVINAWVSRETAGRIKALIDQLDGGTALVIANTVYLRASWLTPFQHPAAPAPFRTAAGTTVQAPTMSDVVGGARYAASGGWQALEMPYAAGTASGGPSGLAMWILLPPAGQDPLAMLAPATLAAVATALAGARVQVTMPTWNVTGRIDLKAAMTGLGATGIFDDGDYAGISPGIAGIDSAVHAANITVTEEGTEAAAATALAFTSSATLPPPLAFTADRPFAYVIVGGDAHVPLFTGIIRDPTA